MPQKPCTAQTRNEASALLPQVLFLTDVMNDGAKLFKLMGLGPLCWNQTPFLHTAPEGG
jgi:hypothetical protein